MGGSRPGRQTLQILPRDSATGVNEAIALMNLGGAWLSLGDLAQAGANWTRPCECCGPTATGSIGGRHARHVVSARAVQGDDARALALARSALDIAVLRRRVTVKWRRCSGWARPNWRWAATRRRGGPSTQAQARALGDRESVPASRPPPAWRGWRWRRATSGGALREVEPVLAHLAGGGTLDGTENPRLIELTCHRVLARVGDPRAAEWLTRAHDALQAQAAAIPDAAMRQGYLQNIPLHREIVAAWAARKAGTR